MAEPKKIKDATRAIDGTDLIARARRRALVRLVWQVIGWGLLAVFIALMWRCLSGIFEYQDLTEVPISDTRPDESAPR